MGAGIRVQDQFEFGQVELAGTHRSDAGSQEAVDGALLDALMDDLRRDGYVVLADLVGREAIARIKAEVEPLLDRPGRNNFEGFGTQRLYALMAKTTSCDALVEHPLVLGLLDRILEENYLLSQIQAIRINPGESQQPIHHDDALYPVPRPRRPLGAATIFAIDDFTADNGATVIIPGSHTWGNRAPTADELAKAKPAVMPAGSCLFFLGTLWHAGGANHSVASRLCVTAQYCAPWLRPQENYFLSVPLERVRESSPHIQRLLGYSIHKPFVGFVDGCHPKRVLERR